MPGSRSPETQGTAHIDDLGRSLAARNLRAVDGRRLSRRSCAVRSNQGAFACRSFHSSRKRARNCSAKGAGGIGAAQADPAAMAAANREAATAIEKYINSIGLTVTGTDRDLRRRQRTAKVFGVAKDQATKEKVILAAGNVHGVAAVDDNMTVDLRSPKRSSTRWSRATRCRRSRSSSTATPTQYMNIFEANKPMLTHPDKIYPGQNLRIPPQVAAPPPAGRRWPTGSEVVHSSGGGARMPQLGSTSTRMRSAFAVRAPSRGFPSV